MTVLVCPLCDGDFCPPYFQDKRRRYFQCRQCCLVFVDPSQRLNMEQEKAEYDLHQNNADDPGYQDFLSRLTVPLLQQLRSGMTGLDFGCGPGPVLADMMRLAGFDITLYDCFYQNHPERLEKNYDFITASEVLEHLFEPGKELNRLWSLINPGGCLAVMTKRVIDVEAFSCWHYKNDPTHVSFFSDKTFNFLADSLGAELQLMGADVAILSKLNVVA